MKKKIKPALVCFLIGLALIQFVGLNGLARIRELDQWIKVEATILSNEVTLDSARNEYHLGIKLRAPVDGKIYSYSIFKNAGAKGHMDKLAETTFAPGTTVPFLINPQNPAEHSFPQRTLGPWIAGILPGVFFILIGLSALWKQPAISAPESP